ncbi:hypothetical protein SNOG_02765 [Parastagonospora nodorum SN15]|uniref:Uncharacterized protein n=1 Tax=Phaeosphaeria nodorum (strain SN15 / ATCC MYA-4574 / FGSC 10173) TaxID=321614 RepID=Q0UZP9_PHANO|nr:hypothetical protein SNOG_02765 [Parastagonospora nodorum SN15]EAT89496.1 hypothetical protein SNOG_02765 [Parastagonospora nodorum SN15]
MPKLRVSLVADYTLSFRHLAIGFFAHTFLVAQKSFFFDHAGLLYSTQSPSWVPVCRSDREWERALVGAIPRNIDITPFDAIATVDCMVYLDERSMVTLKEMVVAYDYQPAYSSPFVVDSATGALLMNLTHLFMFEHEPKVLPTQGSLHFYEVVTTATLEPIPRLCLFASTQLQIGKHHSSVGFSQSDWPTLRNLCTLRLSEAQTNVQSTINNILKLLVD